MTYKNHRIKNYSNQLQSSSRPLSCQVGFAEYDIMAKTLSDKSQIAVNGCHHDCIIMHAWCYTIKCLTTPHQLPTWLTQPHLGHRPGLGQLGWLPTIPVFGTKPTGQCQRLHPSHSTRPNAISRVPAPSSGITSRSYTP